METTTPNRLDALRHLTLAEVEQRIADIDAERASLSVLRRSLAARERTRRRTQQQSVIQTESHTDE